MHAAVDSVDLDPGPRTLRSGTERTCALTRQVRPVDDLIRFVVSPENEVTPDLKRKLPGRGLWLSANHAAVADATKRGVFNRGFKRNVKTSPALADEVEALLVRAAIDALAIAGKAGLVTAGFTNVERALRAGAAVALIHASDAAPDGVRKLEAIARQSGGMEIPVIQTLTSEQLDLALGRSNVIHAALIAGAAIGTFLSRCQILVRYRMVDDGHSGAKTTKKNSGSAPADAAQRD